MRMNTLARAVARAASRVQVLSDYISMTGGLDEITAPLSRPEGRARASQNFEAEQLGGYRRIAGYERYSGKAKPSDALYSILSATITGSPAVGNTLTGATSGATGYIIALPADGFVITKVVGTFVIGENLNVGGPVIAVATSAALPSSASTQLLHAQYRNLAADVYRALIAKVPGEGDILGVWLYNDVVYAFRNNVGSTLAEMYKSTTSGWSKIVFEYEVGFTAGSGSLDDGDTLTQGGVTATIRRVVVRTGAIAGSNAVGILVISVTAGGNFAAGAATSTGGGTCTLTGAQTAITLTIDGRFEFITENFFGSTNTKRMYGCDGVNRAFEFDGSYFVPIPTGMTVDKPNHIWAHRKHLMLSFKSSVQNSSIGAPFGWSPITGAAELGMGDDVTGFATVPGSDAGGALAIFTRNRLSILYGSSSADWNLIPYKNELGAFPYTIQEIGYTVFLDDRGITDIQTAQSFGNFAHGVLSGLVRDTLTTYKPLASASCVSRERSQYRLFFSNNYALYLTAVGRKIVGIMPILFESPVLCCCSAELNDGTEAMFFGSDDGYIYQMDKGTSFDGEEIEYYLDLAYNFAKSPRITKRYRDVMLEMSGSSYVEIDFGYSLGYGTVDLSQPSSETVTNNFAETLWDGFTWDQFFWDGQTLIPSVIGLEGEAENISLGFRGSSDYFEPFTLTGAVVQYTPRQRRR